MKQTPNKQYINSMIEHLMLQIQMNNWKIKALMMMIEVYRSDEPECKFKNRYLVLKQLNFNKIAVLSSINLGYLFFSGSLVTWSKQND